MSFSWHPASTVRQGDPPADTEDPHVQFTEVRSGRGRDERSGEAVVAPDQGPGGRAAADLGSLTPPAPTSASAR